MSVIVIPVLLFIVVLVAAIVGYKLNSLSLSGAFATMIVGTAILIGFGMKGLTIMGTFFVTSSLWSKYKSEKKKAAEEKNDKSGARDAVQVFANGGLPALISLLYLFYQEELLLYMFLSALATANSDTWASEIGSLSRSKPVSILSLRKVAAGTSGAMSKLGTTSALMGALLIGIISDLLWDEVSIQTSLFICLAGFCGNLIDTLLGATVQVTYICEKCKFITEKRYHCNQVTVLNKGYRFFNNDSVNFLSITFGTLLILLFPV